MTTPPPPHPHHAAPDAPGHPDAVRAGWNAHVRVMRDILRNRLAHKKGELDAAALLCGKPVQGEGSWPDGWEGAETPEEMEIIARMSELLAMRDAYRLVTGDDYHHPQTGLARQ